MAITKIIVSNFKSFDKIDVNIGNFGILIGANASGKSNFIQVFKFVRDILNFGLENAISMQGGLEYLANAKVGAAQHISIEISSDIAEEHIPQVSNKSSALPGISVLETVYKFALRINDRKTRFEIIEDSLTQKCSFHSFVKYRRKPKIKDELGRGRIQLSRGKDQIEFTLTPPKGSNVKIDDIFPLFATRTIARQYKLGNRELLITTPCLYFIGPGIVESLKNISIYDFDPKLSKKPQAITGRAKLEEDGSNLAIAISNLLQSGTKKRKLFNLIGDLLPSVDELGIQNLANTVSIRLREKYFDNKYFPAFLISDGTINLTALTIALFFESNQFTIIEEPERNIHPYLISRVVEFMREASQNTQIITTTHNPEMIKHSSPDELFLVSRNKDGYSSITKPAKKKEIKIFLKNEMSLDDLFTQNLLEV